MSWDVLVLNYEGAPPPSDQMDDAPPPKPLGPAARVRKGINAYLPGVSWSANAGGVYEGEGYTIEFGFSKGEPIDSIMLHVRGEGDAIAAMLRFAEPNGWSLYDCSTDEYLDPANPSSEGWEGFQDFRDEALGSRKEAKRKGKGKP